MIRVVRTEEYTLAHAGKKGMKWGYNDGSRNGRRTAAELQAVAKAVAEYNSKNADAAKGTDDVEGDYHEANNMLKYLGITLDLQSDDEKVAETMAIYNQMKASKDSYKTQHEWLKAFSGKLAKAGYDMGAVDKMLDENKDKLNVMKTGTGTGNREKSNQDWKENDAKKSSKSSSKSTSEKKKSKKSKKSSSKSTSSSTPKKTEKAAPTKTVKAAGRSRDYSYEAQRKAIRSKTSVTHSENQNGEELYHHGILGQKWGVRRYQNSDGSLTDEGRKRYGNYSHMSDDELRSTLNRKRLEKRYKELKVGYNKSISKGAGDLTDKASSLSRTLTGKKSDTTKATNAVGNVVRGTTKIVDKVGQINKDSKKNKIDVSKMSTQELQKAVNRMQMENELRDLERNSNAGHKATIDTLQTIGLVATTAVAIAPMVKSAKPVMTNVMNEIGHVVFTRKNRIRIL